MLEAQNTKVVQDAYAAFSRGDIQGVLDTLSEDINWKPVTGAASYVPMAGERRDKKGVADFFKKVGENIKFSQFEPREFISQGDRVVTLGHYKGTSPSGRTFDSDFVMVFKLRNGKVTHFQEFLDVAQLNAAYQPATV